MCWSSTVPEYDEGEELDRGLGVVGLEEDEGSDDECREHGGEEAGLFSVSGMSYLKESTLTKTRRVSMSSEKSDIIFSSWLRSRSWMNSQPLSGTPPYSVAELKQTSIVSPTRI